MCEVFCRDILIRLVTLSTSQGNFSSWSSVKPLTDGRTLSKTDLSAFGSGTAVTVEEGSGAFIKSIRKDSTSRLRFLELWS